MSRSCKVLSTTISTEFFTHIMFLFILCSSIYKIVIYDKVRVIGGINHDPPVQCWVPKLVYNNKLNILAKVKGFMSKSEKKIKNIFKNLNIFANLSYMVKLILNSITIWGGGRAFFYV